MPHAFAHLGPRRPAWDGLPATVLASLLFATAGFGCAHAPRQRPQTAQLSQIAPSSQTAQRLPAGPQAGPLPNAPEVGPEAAPASAPDAAANFSQGPSVLALGVFEVQLPGCGPGPTAAEAAFCASASRAVRQAYQDDNDDPSVLLALANDLEVNPDLGRLHGLWRSPLGHALSRSEGLLRLGPTLRLLRRSMADAYLDQVSQIYRGVNTEACRSAFALLPADEPHWLEMVVTIEPLGTYPLSRLRRFCLDSRTLSQKERQVPGQRATAALARDVRRLWQAAHLDATGAVRQVRLTQPWHRHGRAGYATLELALGIRRSNRALRLGQDESERCSVLAVQLVSRGKGRTPQLAWVHDEGPIACSQLTG